MSQLKDIRNQKWILFHQRCRTHCFHGTWCCEDNAFFCKKIISLSGILDIKNGQKKVVISTQILLQKAVNYIQIFAGKTISDSFDFAIKDIAGALFTFRNPAIF